MSGNTSHSPHPRSLRDTARVIHIVRGDPPDEELAALTAVVASLASAGSAGVVTPSPPAPRSAWADPVHRLRTPLHPGSGAWRTSTRPQ